MSSYAVFVILLVSVLVSSVQSYRFLRDRYLMRGCPIVDCSQEEEIPSICRFPTLYSHNGRMCRGCYSDWCKGYFWQPSTGPKDTGDSKDAKEIKNTTEGVDTKDKKETKDTNDLKDSKYVTESVDSNGVKESKVLENSTASKDC